MCLSEAQHATARPAHHTPICPANLGECPEAPAVPATPRSRRGDRGSRSLGSAQPGAEGPRAPRSPGRPNLQGPQPGGARPVTSGSVPAGRCHAREAHLCQRRGLPFEPRRAGGRAAGKRERGRTAAPVCTPPAQASMVPPLSGSGSG